MKLRTWIGITVMGTAIGALAAMPGVRRAVAKPPAEAPVVRDPAYVPDEIVEKFKRLEAERRPVDRVRRVELYDRKQPPAKVRGYLHKVLDGVALVAVELTPEEVAELDGRRARVIEDIAAAAPNTRHGNLLFVGYTLDPNGAVPIQTIEPRVGEYVELELTRTAEGRPYVTFLRTGVGPRGMK